MNAESTRALNVALKLQYLAFINNMFFTNLLKLSRYIGSMRQIMCEKIELLCLPYVVLMSYVEMCRS